MKANSLDFLLNVLKCYEFVSSILSACRCLRIITVNFLPLFADVEI